MAGGNNDFAKISQGYLKYIPTGIIGKAISDAFQPPKSPTITPPLATTPPPSANDQNPALTAQERAKKLQALKMGMASTITNSTFGNAQTTMPGLKAKLGQ